MVFVTDVPIFAPITIGIAYSAVSCFFCSKGGKKITKDGKNGILPDGKCFISKRRILVSKETRDFFGFKSCFEVISLTSHGHESRHKTMVEDI